MPEKLRSLTMHAWAPNLVPASPMSLLMCASKRCRPGGYKVVIYGVVPVGWCHGSLCVSGVDIGTFISLHHMLQLLHFSWSVFNQQRFVYVPISFSHEGFYFKNKVEGSQIFWICLGWGCQARCRLRGSIFGFALGDSRFL